MSRTPQDLERGVKLTSLPAPSSHAPPALSLDEPTLSSSQGPPSAQASRPLVPMAASERSKDATPTLPEHLKLLNGFPRTARFLAADPSKSLLIVRRFDEAAIRNILQLEGRVAALEVVQKDLDKDDFEMYKLNETIVQVAKSWELFMLLGASEKALSQFPEAAIEAWCDYWIQDSDDSISGFDAESETGDSEHDDDGTPYAIWHLNQKIHAETKNLIETSKEQQNLTPSHFGGMEQPSDSLAALLQKRRDLILSKRFYLGHKMKDILEIRRRWEVQEALGLALKEYQEAVFRYRDMLKLQEPAARSDDVICQWVQGNPETNFKAPRQFLPDSAMDKVYQPRPPAHLGVYNRMRLSLRSMLGAAIQRKQSGDAERTSASRSRYVHDRVGIGYIASSDHVTSAISKFDPLLKLGKDETFEYPEVDYIPEKFLNWITTFIILAFAAFLLIGAVWVLWVAQVRQPYQSVQLGLLTFFIIAFGFAINFITTVSRDQIFAATAAYAAVLVVFVGTNNNAGGEDR